MFNWINEIAKRNFWATKIDTEDFHMGFECVLPLELQQLSAEHLKTSQKCNTQNIYQVVPLILDEHELALG